MALLPLSWVNFPGTAIVFWGVIAVITVSVWVAAVRPDQGKSVKAGAMKQELIPFPSSGEDVKPNP